MLYRNLTEISRIVEKVEVTEEGVFCKNQVPDAYGGAKLVIEMVHQVNLADASGRTDILKFNNPTPLNKDKAASTAPIMLDGKEYRPGAGSPPREWTTVANTTLSASQSAMASSVAAIAASDGDKGSYI